MQTHRRLLYTLVVQLTFIVPIFGQEVISDSIVYEKNPSFDTIDIVASDDELTAPINYKSQDSIIYDIKNQMLYLYGDANMDYDRIDLEAEIVSFDWNTMTLTAKGDRDSTGAEYGTPIFKEGDGEYASKKMEYNFKTGKGRTYDVITQQDEAYIHSEVVKKNKDNEWYGLHTRFTTCENHDHPHFYIEAKKSKVVPDKVMVTGPANLVIEGINTPLVLPFAIFPLKKGKRSGLIFPQYEIRPVTGELALRGGGYYWAVNDKLGMSFTTDIYTRGSFGVAVDMDYKKRYQFGGNFFIKYFHTPPTDKLLSKAGKSHDFNVVWSHRSDPKASQKHQFTAAVNAGTATFNRNSNITTEQILTAELSSNITYRRIFYGKPYSLSIGARHSQDLIDRSLTIQAPEISFNLSRITPFQRKIKTDKKAFYENIGITYSTKAKAYIQTIDSLLISDQFLKELKYGIQHKASIDAPFDLFKYFKVTPKFDYTERWYFKKENKIGHLDTTFVDNNDTTFDTIVSRFLTDTLSGFFPVRDFRFSTAVSTAVTGIYNFKGKRLKAIRHVIKPSITYTYSPDFGAEKWDYYDTYYDAIDSLDRDYSHYNIVRNLYGIPGKGLQNSLTFSLTNNIDMKLIDRKDTSNQYKKIPIIENLTFNGGYNFGADSLKINPINIAARSSILNGLLSWNISTTLSAYTRNENNTLVNQTRWEVDKRMLRWENANFNIGLNFKGKKKDEAVATKGTIEEREYIMNNPHLFYDFNIPWSLNLNYHVRLNNGHSTNPDSLVVSTHTLKARGSINITPKWKLNVSTGYDIKNMDFTFTKVTAVRNLHCWILSFDWTAYPLNSQTFIIDLRVLSPLLQELKLSRKQPANSGLTTF